MKKIIATLIPLTFLTSGCNASMVTKPVLQPEQKNVIEFESDDGCKIILRPSGTEPKIKMYISVNEALNNVNEFEKVDKILNDKIDRIIKSIGL